MDDELLDRYQQEKKRRKELERKLAEMNGEAQDNSMSKENRNRIERMEKLFAEEIEEKKRYKEYKNLIGDDDNE